METMDTMKDAQKLVESRLIDHLSEETMMVRVACIRGIILRSLRNSGATEVDIDWEKVAADGIDFAMIRVGYRGSTAGQIYTDEYFEKNIAGATAAGLKIGVYFYSQAINAEEAAEEAAFVLNAIRPYKVTFPVVFDWEIVGGSDARTYTVSRAVLCESAKTFCSAVEDAGYDAMIYFTQYLGYRKYILRQLSDYEFWYAEYEAKPRIVFNFDMWQYSSTGSVNGIDGDVDLNIYFRKN